ncbi:MAG: YitT family protein [Eubacteriales bacterium]|nr:YitT family protein [Eubacteriales bacterium]
MEEATKNKYRAVEEEVKEESKRLALAICGAAVYSAGVNLFIVPAGLYSGGVMGFAQVIRTLLLDYLHLPIGFDIAGLIYYAVNIPVLLLAMKDIGKQFFMKTICCLTAVTLLLSVIPIPETTILPDDILGSTVIGALMCGFGMGVALRMGGSLGGTDIIGLLLLKWKKNLSVGKVNLIANAVLYGICLFLFNISTVIYSLIYAAVSSFTVDHEHSQNINVEVRVITKKDDKPLEQEIFTKLNRGVTRLESTGAYTNEKASMLYILVSKYELPRLKHIVLQYDPKAFIVLNEGVTVVGHYLKKL